MRSIVVENKYSGLRIDKFLREEFPRLSFASMQKALRQKDVKVNGVRIKQDYTVVLGDEVQIYVVDDILDGIEQKKSPDADMGFSIVYEDSNIIIVNKSQDMSVHADKGQSSGTLIDLVRNYLKPQEIFLCHRLDRNTSGLVVLAKNKPSLDLIVEKMESREIKKYYQCLVKGKMENQSAQLKAFLFKDKSKSMVYIGDKKTIGSMEITTNYNVIKYYPKNDISLLEVELVTGRTHQIRAHLAHIDHPVIGDGKYGSNSINRPLGAKYQELCAYKIIFDIENAGHLEYLKNKEFKITPAFGVKLF